MEAEMMEARTEEGRWKGVGMDGGRKNIYRGKNGWRDEWTAG